MRVFGVNTSYCMPLQQLPRAQDAKADGPSFVEKVKKTIKRFVTNLAIDMACPLRYPLHPPMRSSCITTPPEVQQECAGDNSGHDRPCRRH